MRVAALWPAEKNYLLAIEQYGKAIESNPLSAVYHANRAFAHIRMETYGSAVEDAAQAIALDPKYVKVWCHVVLLPLNVSPLRGILPAWRRHMPAQMCSNTAWT